MSLVSLALASPTQTHQNGVGRFRPTEVSIAVSQDIQLDKMESATTRGPGSFYEDELKVHAV
jgi:hypothetical protein